MEIIERLQPPTNVKRVKIFLKHISFYRRFIKDFSKITKPLSNLLANEATFDFNVNFVNTFCRLKGILILALII